MFVRASEGRVLMPHVPALVSESGPSESHSILTLTECRQTGSPVHWPIQKSELPHNVSEKLKVFLTLEEPGPYQNKFLLCLLTWLRCL